MNEAELALLGAMLMDPECIDGVEKLIGHKDFDAARNKYIFLAISEMNKVKQDIDLISLTKKLRKMGITEGMVETKYICRLSSACPTSANPEYYARVVLACSLRRSLKQISERLAVDYQDISKSVVDIVAELATRIEELVKRTKA